MSVGSILKKLCSVLLLFISPFKRLLCWMGRRRKNSGTILPLSNHYPPPDVSHSVPSNETDLEPWDSWGGGDTNSVAGNHHHDDRANRSDKNPSPEDDTEIDFFQDMRPEVKKTKKLYVRKKEETQPMFQSGLSSRLAMTSEIPTMGPDLGAWEDTENSWGDEMKEDLTWEAQAAIREKRKAEREQRHMMQQKKKHEREKNTRRDTHFSAVKLS